ncbi:MAG: hypothetical protein IJS61_10715 [Firmicutes bacterium]|nr:hypothetical protein [Bacillota bacterium]
MSKSAYSIILDDEIVARIDAMAARYNTNRSGIINSILAEKTAYKTPERRVEEILSSVSKMVESQNIMQVLVGSGEGSLKIKSPFRYKYNPTLKYSVILYPRENTGEFRAVMRTQNTVLLNELGFFLQLWMDMEISYLHKNMTVDLSPGRYVRKLEIPSVSDDEAAQLIMKYIQTFDFILKQYFSDGDEGKARNNFIKNVKWLSIL